MAPIPTTMRSKIVRYLLFYWRPDAIAAEVHCGLTIVYAIQSNLFIYGSPCRPSIRQKGAPRRFSKAAEDDLIRWLNEQLWAQQSEMIWYLWEEWGLHVHKNTISIASEARIISGRNILERTIEVETAHSQQRLVVEAKKDRSRSQRAASSGGVMQPSSLKRKKANIIIAYLVDLWNVDAGARRKWNMKLSKFVAQSSQKAQWNRDGNKNDLSPSGRVGASCKMTIAWPWASSADGSEAWHKPLAAPIVRGTSLFV